MLKYLKVVNSLLGILLQHSLNQVDELVGRVLQQDVEGLAEFDFDGRRLQFLDVIVV